MQLLQNKSIRQFIRFGIVGFGSFLIDFGLFYVYKYVLIRHFGQESFYLTLPVIIARVISFFHKGASFSSLIVPFYVLAKMMSFCSAAIPNYIFNRLWTFRSQNPNRSRQFIQFFTVAVIGLVLNASIMYIMHSLLHIPDYFAIVIATGVVMFWNFLANRAWAFKAPPHTDPPEITSHTSANST
jgi:putative flippase GtrA